MRIFAKNTEMHYKVMISAQAEEDLRSIFEYIAYDLHSAKNAIGQLRRLEENITSLDQVPERYRLYESEPWRERGLRVLPVDNYLVFYIPDRESGIVNIIRVMYGGRNVEEQLARFTDY